MYAPSSGSSAKPSICSSRSPSRFALVRVVPVLLEEIAMAERPHVAPQVVREERHDHLGIAFRDDALVQEHELRRALRAVRLGQGARQRGEIQLG